jgi:apolipoprotein N-acyltransferase
MERIAGNIARLKGWRRAAAAIAAGGASALALAPTNAFPVLWLTVPVFVWLIDGAAAGGRSSARTFLAGAAVGWCFGLGYFLGGLWWIGAAFLVDADQFAWLMPIAVVILPAGLALFWGLGAGLAALFWCPGWPRVLVFASSFAAVEWLRGHVLTGFPWNAFGYTITPAPVMMQSAAVVGLWGLTLAAFIIFAAPAALWPAAPPARRGASAFAAFAAALFAAHLGFGAVRLAGAEDDSGGGSSIRIVQPSLDQSEKWQATNEDEIVARYLELSRTVPGGGPDLDDPTVLIWPESAFPFLLSDRPDVLSAIADLLPTGTTLVTGAVRADDPAGYSSAAFNSVLVIDDRGTITAAYDKVHLVPFGEYLPLRPLFDLFGVRQLVAIPEGFLAGSARLTLTLPGAPPFAPLICYEIIFPGAVLATGLRPGWMLNLTNDTWFGDTPGPRQHFLQGRVRAVEEGLPLVRAANSGISGIVDSYGRVVASLDVGTAGIINGNIPEAVELTFYSRARDSLFLGFWLACLVAASIARGRRRVQRN